MSRTFLFGGNQSSQQSQYLVQMKAGKMVRNGNTVRILNFNIMKKNVKYSIFPK